MSSRKSHRPCSPMEDGEGAAAQQCCPCAGPGVVVLARVSRPDPDELSTIYILFSQNETCDGNPLRSKSPGASSWVCIRNVFTDNR